MKPFSRDKIEYRFSLAISSDKYVGEFLDFGLSSERVGTSSLVRSTCIILTDTGEIKSVPVEYCKYIKKSVR